MVVHLRVLLRAIGRLLRQLYEAISLVLSWKCLMVFSPIHSVYTPLINASLKRKTGAKSSRYA